MDEHPRTSIEIQTGKAAPLELALALIEVLSSEFGAIVETVDLTPDGCGEITLRVDRPDVPHALPQGTRTVRSPRRRSA